MAIYTKTKGLQGSTIYRRSEDPKKAGKLVKTTDVPSNIVDLLEHQDSIDDANLKLQSPYRKCIFDGEYTKLYRMVNQQTLYVCEEHYQTMTIGQLAQQAKLNEKPDYEALDKLLNGDQSEEIE